MVVAHCIVSKGRESKSKGRIQKREENRRKEEEEMGFEKKEEFVETSFLTRNITPISTWCICFIFWIAVGMDPEDKMTQPPLGESKMEYGGGVFLILTVRCVCVCVFVSCGCVHVRTHTQRERERKKKETDGRCHFIVRAYITHTHVLRSSSLCGPR